MFVVHEMCIDFEQNLLVSYREFGLSYCLVYFQRYFFFGIYKNRKTIDNLLCHFKHILFQIDQWKHPDKFIRCLCHTFSYNDNVSVHCNLYCNRYKIGKVNLFFGILNVYIVLSFYLIMRTYFHFAARLLTHLFVEQNIINNKGCILKEINRSEQC